MRIWCGALLVVAMACGAQACKIANAKPNCDKMRACCEALTGVENGLPQDQEILCHHNPELDEGCIDTVADIKKFTPEKNLPAVCR